MPTHLAKISNVYHDLSDRYGPDDPIAVQLREEIQSRESKGSALPFGERRKANLPPHLWNQRMRYQGTARRQRPTSGG